jgi:hypothetical protein
MAHYGNISIAACSPSHIPYPAVFGTEVLSLQTTLVTSYSGIAYQGFYLNHGSVTLSNTSFCNVTVTYTHAGMNDTINAEVWLPIGSWNGKMQGMGGGGWVAGAYSGWGGEERPFPQYQMLAAVGEGYVAVTTDAGHKSGDPSDWALVSPGNVNMHLVQNMGTTSLQESALMGKQLTNTFYGTGPSYSYWSGCSQGGRQGIMLAQRYPDLYDGIAAAAPAIYFNRFFSAMFWPQVVMNELGEYPYPCEFDAITAAAISACDADDGVIDGIISYPWLCHFDPFTVVGTSIICNETGSNVTISKAAATVANATWAGPSTVDGKQLWYGVNKDAILTGDLGLAKTTCSTNGTCIGDPVELGAGWFRIFLAKNPDFNLASVTHEQYDQLFRESLQQYTSVIGTDDADLSAFRKSGGKMITYHGMVCFILSWLSGILEYLKLTVPTGRRDHTNRPKPALL